MNATVIFLCGILALLLAVVLVFTGICFTRIQTVSSIKKLTGYATDTISIAWTSDTGTVLMT